MSIARPISRGISRPISRGIVRGDAIDPDAAAWIAAVEAEDGQALEPGILEATSTLFHGLKNTESRVAGRSNWEAMDQIGILAVARTIDGGLITPKGPDATMEVAFVTGDISRGEGWIGNAAGVSGKALNTGLTRGSSSDDLGLGFYVADIGSMGALGGTGTTNDGAFHSFRSTVRPSIGGDSIRYLLPDPPASLVTPTTPAYMGFSTLEESLHTVAFDGSSSVERVRSQATSAPESGFQSAEFLVFNVKSSTGVVTTQSTDARIGFWHTGKAHDPFAVRPLVETYFSAIQSILT